MKSGFLLQVGLVAVVLLAPTLGLAESKAMEKGQGMTHKGHMHGDEMSMHKCMGGCPMQIKDAEVKVENTSEGAVITVTSKNPETVKAIQEQAQKCLEWKKEATQAKDDMVTCPVMGTKLPKSKAVATREYNGKKYYLCCQSCVEAWDKDPAKYATQ
ncbi:MAG: YHS domain-containing protein [candidate division FCPU426 bacterium]